MTVSLLANIVKNSNKCTKNANKNQTKRNKQHFAIGAFTNHTWMVMCS